MNFSFINSLAEASLADRAPKTDQLQDRNQYHQGQIHDPNQETS